VEKPTLRPAHFHPSVGDSTTTAGMVSNSGEEQFIPGFVGNRRNATLAAFWTIDMG
jgi:hypothetical protein